MTVDLQKGDRVTLIGVPAQLRDVREVATRSLFDACVGRSFVVAEATDGVAELHVGSVFGEADQMQTIWVETKYLKHQA